MAKVHIVGAGLAGLACAVSLASKGIKVILYEGAVLAGGRCRSFHDEIMGCTIDNGNHLLLSGNSAVNEFLALIGAESELVGPDRAIFPFIDLTDQSEWTVEIDRNWWPTWLYNRSRRIPGIRLRDCLKALKLLNLKEDCALQEVLDNDSKLYKRFFEPLAVGVLNTPARTCSAALLATVVKETFGRGGGACKPRMAKRCLSDTFIHPALSYLSDRKCNFHTHHSLRALSIDNDRVNALQFYNTKEVVAANDRVVLAIPAHVMGNLLPTIKTPNSFHPIVNAHFRLNFKIFSPQGAGLLGVVGGTAQWVFFRDDILSVTVSAADDLSRESNTVIANRIWCDLRKALTNLPEELPMQHRIIKERRATFSQTPASIRYRSTCKTGFDNLFVAGDWTDTGLPATIEGAIRSGFQAAGVICGANR